MTTNAVRCKLLFLVSAAALAPFSTAGAQWYYTPDPLKTGVLPSAINSLGQVVGESTNNYYSVGFLDDHGVRTILPGPAVAINDNVQIVGNLGTINRVLAASGTGTAGICLNT